MIIWFILDCHFFGSLIFLIQWFRSRHNPFIQKQYFDEIFATFHSIVECRSRYHVKPCDIFITLWHISQSYRTQLIQGMMFNI